MFSCLNWSRQENKVVYVAEKKLPKTTPFYQQKSDSDSKDDQKVDTLAVICGILSTFYVMTDSRILELWNRKFQGQQHAYEDDWGEQMSPKTHPVIVVCDVNEKKISVLEGVPDDISSGQVIFDPDGTGVVGVGVHHKPRRLGIIYCTNRPMFIFHLTLDGKYGKSQLYYSRWKFLGRELNELFCYSQIK